MALIASTADGIEGFNAIVAGLVERLAPSISEHGIEVAQGLSLLLSLLVSHGSPAVSKRGECEPFDSNKTDRQAVRQTDRRTARQTDRQTDRQTARQPGSQAAS